MEIEFQIARSNQCRDIGERLGEVTHIGTNAPLPARSAARQ
jgi:hypothetical protein